MINIAIVNRYFQALDILIQNERVKGVSEFCERHEIDRRNFSRFQKEPERKFYLYLLYIMVEHYQVNANFLITGKGKLFLS